MADEDPLGVLLKQGPMASSSVTRIDGRDRPQPEDLLKGPKNAAPAAPTSTTPRSEQQEYASMERDVALFFADRPINAQPPLQRPKVSEMPENEETIKILMNDGRYRLAIRVANLLLDTTDIKEIETRSRLRGHLASSFFRLGEFKQAKELLNSSRNDTSSRDLDPFNTQLLRCELAHYLGDNDETVRALCQLSERTAHQKTGENEENQRRTRVISGKIVDYLVLGGKLELALGMLHEGYSENKTSEPDPQKTLKESKIYFKMGQLEKAREALESYSKLKFADQDQVIILRSMLLAAEDKFKESMEILTPLIEKTNYQAVDAVNNFSVCALYTNQIDTAIKSLEEAIRSNPFIALNMTLVRNLVALYDLCTMSDEKAVMRKIVDRYAPDGVSEECRRLGLW